MAGALESRPQTGLASVGIVGSKPSTRQGTTPVGTGRRTGTSASEAGLSMLAQKLVVKLRLKFGEYAADVKSQEIITSEVLKFMQKGLSVREDDLFHLEGIIRARLTGQTPLTNTLAQDKLAQIEGDEWAKIYKYSIAEGIEKEKAAQAAMRERQRQTRDILQHQMRERDAAKKAEHEEEMAYAHQEQAALKSWEATQEARRKLQQEIALKLKQEREEQLQEKNARIQNALARLRSEESDMAARISYDTKQEFKKAEELRAQAKVNLKEYMQSSESLKLSKQQAKEAACQEDLHYKAAWEAQLNKQEKDRLDRLARTKAQQERTAAFAASVTLTENKRWMDPALTEKQRQEREAKLEKQEAERKLRVRQSGLEVAKRLEEQIREKEAAQQAVRLADELKAQAVVQRAVAEEEREQARRAAREAEKLRFRLELEAQMKDNVAKKRNQPITATERLLNRELLEKVHTWAETGRVDCVART